MAASNVNQGQLLAEVFSVRVNDIAGEDPGNLYGTIAVKDAKHQQYLYNRQRADSESIRPGQNVLLTGPPKPISADKGFTIYVDLKAKETDDASPDKEVSRGKISWNPSDGTNTLILPPPVIVGKHGSVTLTYAVLTDAAAVSVDQVVLVDADGEESANVYGGLSARNGIGESELFRKTASESVEVLRGQPIPLSRSVVAVPWNSSLVVVADLYDHDDSNASDAEIANGNAEFDQASNNFDQFIKGKNGKITVSASWNGVIVCQCRN